MRTQRYAIFRPASSGLALPGAAAVPGRVVKGGLDRFSEAFAAPRQEPDRLNFANVTDPPDIADEDTAIPAPRLPLRLIPQAVAGGAAGEPWGVQAVGAAQSGYNGATACVAVLDTGIDPGHPAFAGLDLGDTNYEDFTGTGKVDRSGHGTHVAGIIFGRDVDGQRIGVARGVTKVRIAKVADKDTLTSTDQLEKALMWAIDRGANIICMSVGIDFLAHAKALQAENLPEAAALSQALTDYRDYCYYFDQLMARVVSPGPVTKSALVIAAAGNESHADGEPSYRVSATLPATAMQVISVGAVGRDGAALRLAPFSNERAEICAPGVGILSAVPGGGLGTMTGTSQAAPHAAGVAALWHHQIRKDGRLPNSTMLRERLFDCAEDRITPRPAYEEARRGLVRAP